MLRETSFFKVLALLAADLRARIGVLALVMLLASIATLGEKAPLLLLQPLFDRVLFPAQAEGGGDLATRALGSAHTLQEGLNDWFFGPRGSIVTLEDKSAMLWRVVLAATALTAIAALASYAFTLLSRWVALRMVIDLRMRLARHLLSLSMRYHGERRFGDLLSRVSSDVTSTLGVVNILFKDLTREPLLVLASLGVAFAAAPVMRLTCV